MPADRARPSIGKVVLKWLCSVFLGIVLLVCVTESKLGILNISNKMRETSERRFVRFVMLFLVVLVPSVVNLLRGIWRGAFRHNMPRPRKPAFLWGFVVSLLEALGLCLFVFHIPGIKGIDQPCKVILIMNGVHFCPALYNAWQAVKTKESIVRNTFATIVMVAFVVISFWLVQESIKVKDGWLMPVAVMVLSFAWNPAVQRKLVETPGCTQRRSNNGSYNSMGSTLNNSVSEGGEAGNSGNTGNRTHYRTPTNTEDEPATWKLILYISFLKIIFIVVISIVLFFFVLFENRPSIEDFTLGWSGWGQYTWISNRDDLYLLTVNIVGSAVGYIAAYMACTACMQRLAFAVPLILATPVSIILLLIPRSCDFLISTRDRGFVCNAEGTTFWLIIAAAVCLIVYQFTTVGWYHLKTQTIVMQKERKLFWVPTYNAVLLEQWLILVRRSNCNNEDSQQNDKPKVIMCTTMFREAEHEMRQLLESIQSIRTAQNNGRVSFEFHILFDGAMQKSCDDARQESTPNDFALHLIILIELTLDLTLHAACKIMTPYGMALVWKKEDRIAIDLIIHLKDNTKVKNRKRWSQVMYMEYVLNMVDEASLDETYILTTDADVSFTSNSVEALLDLMTRDHSVGAVCARTHPLGKGLLVWYQTFEYAIGHWFQKAAEQVTGSVLCSPGCFSVYRCNAIREILPEYATDVTHASDFLTKDMGEDRWLCTLMVKSGWKIEYCAAAENSTYCPDDFDEFFKQRRRWIASTLANMMIFIFDWRTVSKANHHISFAFLVYQSLLFVSTLIGPSSVILVVSGGLKYAWDVSNQISFSIQCIVCIGYIFWCLLTSSKKQLLVSKLLVILYALIMVFVVIGIVLHIIADFRQHISNKNENATTTSRPSNISPEFRFSTTTVYIGYMVALFVVTGVLHFKECIYLLHGLLYLLFVPSGYLILVLYSICNITDITWGTREERQKSNISSKLAWRIQCEQLFRYLFIRFFKGQSNYRIQANDQIDGVTNNAGVLDEDFARSNMHTLPVSRSGRGNVDDEQRLANIRNKLTPSELRALQEVNQDEYDFWDTLKKRCLSPQSTSDRQTDEMKAKLKYLRNKWLVVFMVSNAIWLVLIATLANKSHMLLVYGSDPLGLVVLLLFSAVVAIQFLAMLVHRLITFTHFLARAPYSFKNG